VPIPEDLDPDALARTEFLSDSQEFLDGDYLVARILDWDGEEVA